MNFLKKILKILGICILILCMIECGVFLHWWYYEDGERYYRYTFHTNHEPFTLSNNTNTDACYSDEQLKEMLSSYFDDEILDEMIENSYIIPGLKSTRTITSNNDHYVTICTSMTPQGVTMSDEYVFISAYCQCKKHNSVIYMIDRKTHSLIKEIVLPDQSHVGSIAYDWINNHLWVCCYEEENKVAFVCSLKLNTIKNYDFDKTYSPIRYSAQYPIDTMKRSSFMTYYFGSLYVGYFASSSSSQSTVQEFRINHEGDLTYTGNLMSDIYDDEPDSYVLPSSLFYINGLAQGVAINASDIFITQSHGSDSDSHLVVFENKKDEDGNVNAKDENMLYSLHLPCMAEDCHMDDSGNLYICFESSAYAYRARKSVHVDRILFLPNEFLKAEN